MRYTIEGFSQAFALTLKKEFDVNGKMVLRKIDCTDLVILRWFVDFYPNMKKVECEGKQYAWLTHKKLLEDLPLIDISKKAFIERMQKLVDFEILTYKLVKEGGTFSLYGFGKNYNKLVNDGVEGQTDAGCPNESTQGGSSNVHGVDGQTDNKDSSFIDSSFINPSNNKGTRSRFVPPTVDEVRAYCEERKNGINAEQFVDYYEARGWMIGKNKMKNWKASVRTWERNGFSTTKNTGAENNNSAERKNDLDNYF